MRGEKAMSWVGWVLTVVGLLLGFVVAREWVRVRFPHWFAAEVAVLLMAIAGQVIVVFEYYADQKDGEAQRLRVKQLEQTVARHEFIPLNETLRTRLITRLKAVAPDLQAAGITVLLSHEVWSTPPVKQFADQLAEIYREAGITVEDPEAATVYLTEEPNAVEWRFFPEQRALLEPLIVETFAVLPGSKRHQVRSFPAPGKLRIHFAGKPYFAPNGVLTME